ncbi:MULTISPECIES: alpha-glucosidase [Hungatella]|uniref:Alpha,alpha-phosphotrehalase n=1 Tax=Hungatella hathewayi TaxID=154046 RepID=A0AAW9WFE0_9FIRM|nr:MULTISPECIES: alpha-glucosidase [Hungatella]MCQ4829228.1 alpha-glucosidase [Hungatella sp. SL.1.14]MUB63324.1 alpha,alpha-phosphotrehalase [Hungatella hathewayi]CUQ13859.1 alpha amylase [Hungatella hathewayi]
MKKKWWQESVVYQIYPRSFQDTNGDGIGDLQGIIRRLDYLKYLGIDVIWLSPVYASPQADNGYDISDYYDIAPEFGSMKDMDQLIEEAGNRGIKLVMDLVVNHTSDEHPWFLEAKKGKTSKFHDYYVWRDGSPDELPNQLKSSFGGSAWEWCEEAGRYYLHLYSKRQPDLNWENGEMRQEIYKMMNWWLDKGIGGFRMDVIDKIGKVPDQLIVANGPKLHDYIKEMNSEVLCRRDVLTVGESWAATTENAKQYSNPDGSELSMVFQFEYIKLDKAEGKAKWELGKLDFINLKEILSKWQCELEGRGWNSLFWNNHDVPRIVSRWGNDGRYRKECARMFATFLHGMQGTPYIYQGEEIGMTNVRFAKIEDYRDIETLNLYQEYREAGWDHDKIMQSVYAKGRDNARTPMQWDNTENAGFTEGKPWLLLNPNYLTVNVQECAEDDHSILQHYRRLIRLRRDSEWKDVMVYGSYKPFFEKDPDVFAYKREKDGKGLFIVGNFHETERAIELPVSVSELLLSNYEDSCIVESNVILRPYEALLFGMRQV